jgi:uncharacterized protein (UPF0332 family)
VSSDPDRAAVSRQKANAHLLEAEAQDADASPMAVIYSSYYAMFHAPRAVLVKATGRTQHPRRQRWNGHGGSDIVGF